MKFGVGDKVRYLGGLDCGSKREPPVGTTGRIVRRGYTTWVSTKHGGGGVAATFVVVAWEHAPEVDDGGWWDYLPDEMGNKTPHTGFFEAVQNPVQLQDYADYYTSITEIEP